MVELTGRGGYYSWGRAAPPSDGTATPSSSRPERIHLGVVTRPAFMVLSVLNFECNSPHPRHLGPLRSVLFYRRWGLGRAHLPLRRARSPGAASGRVPRRSSTVAAGEGWRRRVSSSARPCAGIATNKMQEGASPPAGRIRWGGAGLPKLGVFRLRMPG